MVNYTGKLYDPSFNLDAQAKGGIYGIFQICGKLDAPPDWFTYQNIIDELQNTGQIGAASNSFLKSLISETENLPDYNLFIAKVNQLERNFDSSSLSISEKDIVDGIISVSKASANYWNNYYSIIETTDGKLSAGIRCFICVAKNDIAGALIGFIAGNCICKKIGVPPNPKFCGAIGAAIFGGFSSWAAKVCPDVCKKCKKPNPNSYPSWICSIPWLF